MVLMEDRFVEFISTTSSLMGEVEHMEKCIEELESIGDWDELHREMHYELRISHRQ